MPRGAHGAREVTTRGRWCDRGGLEHPVEGLASSRADDSLKRGGYLGARAITTKVVFVASGMPAQRWPWSSARRTTGVWGVASLRSGDGVPTGWIWLPAAL